MFVPEGAGRVARATRLWMLWLSAAAVAACGPLRPRAPEPAPALVAAADSAAATESAIRERGAFPSAADLADRAVLYSEMMQSVDRRLELHRDTIRGGGLVLRWLERRRNQGGSQVPFSLRTGRVFACRGAVLQYGEYPIPADDAKLVNAAEQPEAEDAKEAWVPFAARWRAPADGPMRLEAIWLGPLDSEVRPGLLAEDCTDTGAATFARDYAARRWAVEGAVGYTLQLPASGALQDALTDHGWDGRVASTRPLWGELGVFWRIRPGWQVEGLASYQAPASVEGSSPQGFRAHVEWTTVTAGGLLMAELGRFRLGVGPAVAYTSWSWSDEVVNVQFQPGQPTSGTSLSPGALAEVGYVQTFRSHVYFHVRARYGYFTDAETPGFRDLAPVTVPMSDGRLSVGFGYWW